MSKITFKQIDEKTDQGQQRKDSKWLQNNFYRSFSLLLRKRVSSYSNYQMYLK
jgi:hypothetical protein